MPNSPTSTYPFAREFEDPLLYLLRKEITTFHTREIIYQSTTPSPGLYLLISGKVKVIRRTDMDSQVLIDIYQANDFFGESSFLGSGRSREIAAALENVSVMCWSFAEVEAQIEREPRLGIALLHILSTRTTDLAQRIESFAGESCMQRLARSFLRFADRFGNVALDGAIEIPPLTHETISQYVGTSREIITARMNQLRNKGMLRYCRKWIRVFPEPLKQYLWESPPHHHDALIGKEDWHSVWGAR
jgi:CRP/FNR family transcriptional regulator